MRLVTLGENLIDKNLARPIYASNNTILINKGCKLTKSIIDRILNNNINIVYIEDEHNNIEVQEILDIRTRLELLKLLKTEFEFIKKNKTIKDSQKLIYIVEELIKNINLSENAFLFKSISVSSGETKFYNYCLDVTILCIKIGIFKKYDSKKLLNLGLSALLHDLGNLIIGNQIIDLNSKPNIEHLEIGYNFLKQSNCFTPTVYVSVRQHHEFEDGSGLEKIQGDKTYEFAKIINICSTYVHLMNNNKLPNEAIEQIIALATTKFNKDIFKNFIQNIYCYPVGLQVRLSNSIEGIVLHQNKSVPARPIIATKYNGQVEKIDLMAKENLTLFIDKINI